jgi:hypothetical protein
MGASLVLLVGLGLVYLLLGSFGLSHAVADRRAKQVLRDVLSEAHCQQLQQGGSLDVPSPSRADRVYRIPGAGGLVRV